MLVIALGGNALLRRKEKLEYSTQMKNVKKAAKIISDISSNKKVVVTHGNGPQVGNLLVQNENSGAYKVPLYSAVAQSQGGIGSLIEKDLTNEFRKKGVKRSVASILTHVLVDRKDPGF